MRSFACSNSIKVELDDNLNASQDQNLYTFSLQLHQSSQDPIFISSQDRSSYSQGIICDTPPRRIWDRARGVTPALISRSFRGELCSTFALSLGQNCFNWLSHGYEGLRTLNNKLRISLSGVVSSSGNTSLKDADAVVACVSRELP